MSPIIDSKLSNNNVLLWLGKNDFVSFIPVFSILLNQRFYSPQSRGSFQGECYSDCRKLSTYSHRRRPPATIRETDFTKKLVFSIAVEQWSTSHVLDFKKRKSFAGKILNL